MMSFARLIAARVRHEELADYLDRLDPSERRRQVESLSRRDQKHLYALVEGAPAIDMTHFVPANHGDLAEVIHFGKNTIPVPHRFRLFEKRFCRNATRPDVLFGYNEGITRPLIGPGYFVAKSTAERSDWLKHGAIVVNYFDVPDAEVAPGWPEIVPNHVGLQRFVFHQTRDFMRRVSAHVSVGAAFRGDKALGFYFTLCRQDR